jgi:glucose/mannose-6-phosphate isomerase
MLDDLVKIHHQDASDALGKAANQWQQLQYEFPKVCISVGRIENVVFSGMGGSALAAYISKDWPGYTIPFEVSRDYKIPNYVSNRTLFIASSYSGTTEETLSALQLALDKKAQIIVITSGGKLADLAREHKLPLYELPAGFQPRHATLYCYKALITALECEGLVDVNEAERELHETSEFLKESIKSWLPDVQTKDNYTKQIAQELAGLSPVVYTGGALASAGYKWKISFNENAKNVAWVNVFPEFNHNEFLGWSSHPIEKPYAPIFLKSSFDHERVTRRFEVTEQLLSGRWRSPIQIQAQGETKLQQLLWTIAFGDFVSIYLGLLNGLDPTPVELIEKFKKML